MKLASFAAETLYYSAYVRLEHTLAELAEDDPEQMVWQTHEEIARRMGSRREAVTKMLKPLKRAGLIDYPQHHHGIKVLNMEKLRRAGDLT